MMWIIAQIDSRVLSKWPSTVVDGCSWVPIFPTIRECSSIISRCCVMASGEHGALWLDGCAYLKSLPSPFLFVEIPNDNVLALALQNILTLRLLLSFRLCHSAVSHRSRTAVAGHTSWRVCHAVLFVKANESLICSMQKVLQQFS